MRHARAPRPKRRGLLDVVLVIMVILSGLFMLWSVTLLVIWFVATHGGS